LVSEDLRDSCYDCGDCFGVGAMEDEIIMIQRMKKRKMESVRLSYYLASPTTSPNPHSLLSNSSLFTINFSLLIPPIITSHISPIINHLQISSNSFNLTITSTNSNFSNSYPLILQSITILVI